MNQRNVKSLKGEVLPVLALVAALGLLLSSSMAYAQSPSPFAVETNVPGFYAYTQPPEGFDPLTASADDLKLYGYPLKPAPDAPAQALANWKIMVNQNLRRIVPQLKQTNIRNLPAQGLQIRDAKATTYNWSGIVLVETSPVFVAVQAAWIVPPVQQAFGTCSGIDYVAQWVGIDGFNNDLLLQSGTEEQAACSGGVTETEYTPWIEWLPASALQLVQSNGSHLPFAPGDFVLVDVTATDWLKSVPPGGTKAVLNSQSGSLIFVDYTQNWEVSGSFTAASLGGTYVLGHSVEWIVELPGGELSTLANYIVDPWTGVLAENRAKQTFDLTAYGASALYNITMLDNNGKPISFVDAIGAHTLWFFDEGSAY